MSIEKMFIYKICSKMINAWDNFLEELFGMGNISGNSSKKKNDRFK